MKIWWWVGYTNDSLPKGQRALGAVIVQHEGPEHIIAAELIARGLAPRGGRPLFGRIAAEWGPPPAGYEGRLLDKDQAEALAKAWDPGHRGLADPDDIRQAVSDDAALPGDPLFKKPGRLV